MQHGRDAKNPINLHLTKRTEKNIVNKVILLYNLMYITEICKYVLQ